MALIAQGRSIVRGEACGPLLVSTTPLSLWGGVSPQSGRIIDTRHDRCGESVVGRVLALPAEKGSSTGSAVLLELIRSGRAPAAIVTCHLAPVLALGAVVARELYGQTIPILLLSERDFGSLRDGEGVCIRKDGTLYTRAP